MLKVPGYRFQGKIHESANSQVYRGIRERDNLPTIFKILKKEYPTPEEIIRYKLEYKITRSLSLEGVIKAYGLEQYQHTFFIIFEDFGGESLANIITTTRFTLAEFLKLAIKITKALSGIHTAKIIHKDINPSNIVFNPQTQQLKFIDFGISTSLLRETLTLKSPTILEGTLAYISPEQTGRMNLSLDYRSDFYSLGVTFYQLLTHKLPFESNDPLELIHHHLALEPIPPHIINPQIPVIVSEIILKLLAKRVEERYQSTWGIKSDLEECLIQLENQQKIDYFTLAQEDISDQFHIPEKLYGREQDVQKLLAAFDRVVSKEKQDSNGVELVLIRGCSGIGKSALVQEIYQPITKQKGYFVSGKFDQYQRDIPYFAIAQALESLIKQLLTEDEKQLSQWREKLLWSLGSNGLVIIQVVPALSLIVGNQPEIPVLPPMEAQNRFNQVFQKFICVFTQSEHPLVIFLDDLQWADHASLKLIWLLATSIETQSLLLIGAYRDNDQSLIHSLTQVVNDIQQDGGIINQISLAALNLSHINQMIIDTLRCQLEDSLPLAELVELKTGGNPFFINEFLKSLYTAELLQFDRNRKKWQWSIEQIQNQGITDNVVELLVLKIQKLDQQTQQILRISACIGNQFHLETLVFVTELSQQKIAQILTVAIAHGLILSMNDSNKSALLDVTQPSDRPTIAYKFVHDRIQQAAYSLLSPKEQSQTHWQVGQCLLQITSPEQLQYKIFDITNQLNLGRSLIETQSQQNRLAELNLIAGEKAKVSSAYQAAFQYLQIGLTLLNPDSWQTNYDLSLVLYSATAEAAYLSGNFEQVEPLCQQVIEQAKTLIASLKVYNAKIQTYIAQRKSIEAIQISLQLLEQLGVYLPIHPTAEDVQQAFQKNALKLADKPIADLIDLPIISEPEMLAAMQLLVNMCASAYFAIPPLFALIVLKMVGLLMERGNMMLAPFAYAAYGILLCGVELEIETGYQFGQLALNLLHRLDAKPIQARTLFLVSQINLWKTHLRDSLQPLQDCYQIGIDQGDLEFSGYAAMHFCTDSFAVGQPLNELKLYLTNYAQAVKQIKHSSGMHFVGICWQTVHNLIEKVPNPGIVSGQVYEQATRLPQMQQTNFHAGLFYLYLNQLFLCYLFADPWQAIANADLAQEYLPAMAGVAVVPIFYFYDSLAKLAVYLDTDPDQQSVLLQQVKDNQTKMQIWARHAPMNYLHKWYLVAAEQYRVLGEILPAMEAYDYAITLARENKYIQEEALGNELAAKFHLANNRITIAKAYLQEARYGYLRWGAKAKVQDLERRYPRLLELRCEANITGKMDTTQSGKTKLEVLDLETVLKASLAIASEILLDNLLVKMMTILIENAGAQTGYLILPTQDEWYIEAIGKIGEQAAVLQSIPVELNSADSNPTVLPTGIINYVIHTHENVVLDNAIESGNFQLDPWVIQHQSKSLLCVPLLNQGNLTGIVLLENNLTTSAFTSDCIKILQLLSTRAAISIDNARLLNQQEELNAALSASEAALEERVIQRTAELQAANKALEAFAYSVSHDLRAPLRAIDGFSRMLEEDYGQNLDPEANRYLRIVRENGKRMGELIDDLLSLSRLDRHKMTRQPIFPNEMIKLVLSDLHMDLEGREIEFKIAQLPICQGDLSLLKQVWLNLLSNAIKYTRYKSLAQITIDYVVIEGEGVYFIQDNGAGFDMQYADTLFGVFQRLHKEQDFPGTGIGLAIVQRIIQRHGGRIWFEAFVDKGATFYFTL